jgi:hypothetical protein
MIHYGKVVLRHKNDKKKFFFTLAFKIILNSITDKFLNNKELFF